jgi:branched-subunit amino acid aminotransferase/4-amino-4-deoxychorismate lyase
MATVFLNGRFVGESEAVVSVHDAGIQHGVGLFETMLAVRQVADPLAPRLDPDADDMGGSSDRGFRVIHLHEHLRRLRDSAFALGLADRLHTGPLGEAVERTCERAFDQDPGATRLRVRLTLTGGDLNMLSRIAAARRADAVPREAHPEIYPTMLVVAQPATAYPDAMFEQGVLTTLAELRVNPLDATQGHKTLNYWARLRELQIAAAKRAGEAMVFTTTNHLAGGCVSSALIIKGDALITPIAQGEEEEVALERGVGKPASRPPNDPGSPLRGFHDDTDMPPPPAPASSSTIAKSPILPGITRAWALDVASDMGLAIHRRNVTLEDLLDADEVMLTNSSWGVLPVVGLESRTIAQGTVGPMTTRLIEAWRTLTAG